MQAVAEGLWSLADYWEKKGDMGKAVKCLEAICQSHVSFLPIVEVKSRLRVASLLMKHTHNVTQAKAHLERAQLLLKSIPSCLQLKCATYSLLSQCYHLVGATPPQKQILRKALDLLRTTAPSAANDMSAYLWACNFNSQLANALISQGDYKQSISSLESGFASATRIGYPELQMFFATSILHVRLIQWDDQISVETALKKCDEVWDSILPDKRVHCLGLLFYNELLHLFYRLHICDYKNSLQHVDKLDAAMKADMQQTREKQQLTNELDALNQSLSRPNLPSRERAALSARHAQLQDRLKSVSNPSFKGKDSLEPAYFGNARRALPDKLVLAPSPIDGEWLPKGAVYALIDLMVIIFGRPKGLFRDCAKRFQSGMHLIQMELARLGITDGVREVDLQQSAIWMAGVYLMLLMQFLENKVAVELTRSEFIEAQEALVQMRNWLLRFPTILQACESMIEMLRGQYAHSVSCYSEAAFHYIEAAKLTENKSMQAMCQVYAAVSYFCIGDAESSSQALDLIGPVYRMKDSFVGVREEASALFAYGLLLMRQQDLQEARNKLAKGLQIAHNHMGNLQLVAQYLTTLGNLALVLHDTVQAREILRSSLTLSKKLYDLPTQIWVLSVLTALYQRLDEKENERENEEHQTKKIEDLQRRLADARSSLHHIELIDKAKFEVQQFNELDAKRAMGSQSMRVDLDIPESVGISTPLPAPSSSRLGDLDTRRRSKRKL
ncbi:TPR_2 domain-containing protein/Cohesin_load domain-containing protein [Cephalotus follicularis]|uniref:TPR_2 domain-containing protein/Cohesin_load domain-containing protein n=1 Tax=Cephalotus follicularis TaxID=3775 RepID=A0A1Q3AS92_CEPFO|nr:TPR_2 domain-containing protein/Cohesin_load domain-containing protein [Cephalotus follicularis]